MRILLATDLSAHAATAATLISRMALPSGSRVRLVYAVEPIPTVAMFATAPLLTLTDATVDEARAELEAVAKTLEQRDGVVVETVVGLGRAADVVIEECADFAPDLIVIGSRGRGAIAMTVLGSVSAEVIDRAPCPVLVARRPTLARLVLADDGSQNAANGARVIATLEPFTHPSVHVVSVVDVPFPMLMADPTGTTTGIEAYRAYEASLPGLRAGHQAYARERVHALLALGIAATAEQREGEAAEELIAAAQAVGADCIVVGSRGHTGLRRIFIGSVARGVLYHAPCSVLIAHAPRPEEPVAHRDLVSIGGKEV